MQTTTRAHPVPADAARSTDAGVLAALGFRVPRSYLLRRLALERDHEAAVVRRRHLISRERVVRGGLWLAGLHDRARRNALSIAVRKHDVPLATLPTAFDGFTILQLSDLHSDISAQFMDTLIERVSSLEYDLCVLTGDYRARTFGPFEAVLGDLQKLRPHIRTDAYAVLGNHDTIRLVPGMEDAGYKILLNESSVLRRGSDAVYLAGVDDAHFYRLAEVDHVSNNIPQGAVSILLSHTPEVYQEAAEARFDLMLSGHTHGGQICLPGGIPVFTASKMPRTFARGSWRFREMVGYTSAGAGTCIADVRLNCPPEVTLHRLRQASSADL